MVTEDWEAGFTRCFGMWLPGSALKEIGRDSQPRLSDSVLVVINAHYEDVTFKMPHPDAAPWHLRLATTTIKMDKRSRKTVQFSIPSRSLAVFISKRQPE